MVRAVHHRDWIFSLLALFFLSSCASLQTQLGHYEDIDREFSTRNYERAVKEIEKARKEGKYEKKDRVLFYLDMGIAFHNAEKYEESNKYLSRAEQAIEENFTKSISKLATSMLLNDNVLDYSGEDYEDIFINVLMALNYIHLDNLEDAMVEVRRIDTKLSKLSSKYKGLADELSKGKEKIKFKAGHTDLRHSAFGSYMSMISYKQLGKLDDAKIDRRRVEKATRANLGGFLDKALKISKGGKVSMYPICFVGKSPVKNPLELQLDLNPDLKLGRIKIPGQKDSGLFFKYEGEEDLTFKFAVPTIADRETSIKRIRILANGKSLGEMQLLENFSYVARKTFEVKKPIIYLRAGVRTFLKAMADKKASDEIDKKTEDKELLGAILKFAVDRVTEYTESADLRCWRTMPGNAFVGRIDLLPGIYDITFEYLNDRSKVIDRETKKGVEVGKGGLNLIEGVSYR
ncbi:hypothetical protein KAX29_04520 [candidate division WOR-3 bacterium]|nr:hypothetical protein [candidate division WOR-3 bacterium]